MTDKQIFDRAIRLEGDSRVAFHRDACGKDSQQQERIAALVAAHEHGDSLLDTQAIAGDTETVINLSPRKTIGEFMFVVYFLSELLLAHYDDWKTWNVVGESRVSQHE